MKLPILQFFISVYRSGSVHAPIPLLISLVIMLFSLENEVKAQEKCLSHIIEQQKIDNDPEYRNRKVIIERQIQNYIESHKNSREGAQVSIPVVFHVVHNGDPLGTGENLPDALLMAQLNQLNADYARMNADANMTPAAFQGVAVNTMIQFCLATTDPNDQPTTGIVRHNLNLDQSACWNAAFISNNIINPNSWNTAKYLNIFTVQKINSDDCLTATTLGYATIPDGNTYPDDVAVHLATTIGSLANPNPAGGSYSMGRTVTHEVGHWLNLDHIWGDGCEVDDGVADTPDQAIDNANCPTHPSPSCTNAGDMFMNYMDYVDDDCMNMFSAGQAARMMAAINTLRPGLLNSQCGMNPANDGYTCANAIEINAAGIYMAPGPDQGNGAIDGTHANWYKFTPPMSGMIRIYTCGMANGGNTHFHVYDDASVCPTTTNNVQYTQDKGCAADPNDASLGVDLSNIPVTAGVPIFIEWDDLGGNEDAFTWAFEYMGGGNTCTDYPLTNLNLNIPDDTPSGVSSTINVASTGTIVDINVKNLAGMHEYIGALNFTLRSPQNTLLSLISTSCDGGVDFSISLDDQATNALSCPYNTGNTEQPQNPLSIFNGEDAMGNWVLTVADTDGEGDIGALQSWTLEVCVSGGGPCPPNLAVNANPIASGTYQAGTQLTSAGSVGAGNNVTFRAGNNVELQNNFNVPQTAIFQTEIGGCP